MMNSTITVDNDTFCYYEELNTYTWCPSENPLYSVSTGIIVLLSTLYGIISLISVAGNALVIWVVASSRSMQNVTNFFIANLAVSDVTIAIFCIPFQFYAALLQRWELPQFMCKFCPFAQILSVNVSIFTLIAISLDRYKAIMSPLSEKTSKRMAKMAIIVIWAVAVCLAVPMAVFHQFSYVYDENGNGLKPFCSPMENGELIPEEPESVAKNEANGNLTTFNESSGSSSSSLGYYQIYVIILTVMEYIIPLTIISYAYLRMSIKLWLTKTPGNAHDKRDESILTNKKKFIKMLSLVVLLFGICWLPWHVYHSLGLIWPSLYNFKYINIIFFASHWLAMSNSCYNPFIYAIYSEKFKREFKEKAHCNGLQRLCCPQRRSQEDEELALTPFPIGGDNHGGVELILSQNNRSSVTRSVVAGGHQHSKRESPNGLTKTTGFTADIDTCEEENCYQNRGVNA